MYKMPWHEFSLEWEAAFSALINESAQLCYRYFSTFVKTAPFKQMLSKFLENRKFRLFLCATFYILHNYLETDNSYLKGF